MVTDNSNICGAMCLTGKRLGKIYTRSGDNGYTFFPLFKGTRISKDHIILEVIGTIDEVNSFIGLARSLLPKEGKLSSIIDELKCIQNKLFHLGLMIAGYNSRAKVVEEDVRRLEEKIDSILNEVALKEFIIPGGHPSAAALHVARTVCRRLERRLVSLMKLLPGLIDPIVLKYVNRLSDYLFTLSLYINKTMNISEDKVVFK